MHVFLHNHTHLHTYGAGRPPTRPDATAAAASRKPRLSTASHPKTNKAQNTKHEKSRTRNPKAKKSNPEAQGAKGRPRLRPSARWQSARPGRPQQGGAGQSARKQWRSGPNGSTSVAARGTRLPPLPPLRSCLVAASLPSRLPASLPPCPPTSSQSPCLPPSQRKEERGGGERGREGTRLRATTVRKCAAPTGSWPPNQAPAATYPSRQAGGGPVALPPG